MEVVTMKYILGTAVALALVTPALADEFYVVQNPTTRHCTVVEQRPTDSKTIIMGNGHVYTTRSEAESAVKTVCTETTGSSTSTTTTIQK
jgi:hypothetical protein